MSGHLHEDEYVRAQGYSDRLRGYLPTFLAAKVFLRASQKISPEILAQLPARTIIPAPNRDRAVCALANKAANTHGAVRVLCDLGHGDDAMALTRVLLENAVLLEWLLSGDSIYRLDLYCLSDVLFRRRWLELVREHYADDPERVAEAEHAISPQHLAVADFFGDTRHRWAKVLRAGGRPERVDINDMFYEMAHGIRGASKPTFMYDVVYFLHSAYVHSTAPSMRSFTGKIRPATYFDLNLGANDQLCLTALRSSNVCLLHVVSNLASYVGLTETEAEVDAMLEEMKVPPMTGE